MIWFITNWKIVVIAVVIALAGIQTHRLSDCQSDFKLYKEQIKRAAAESAQKGAESGSEATEGVMNDEEDQGDAIDGVVDDVDGLWTIHQGNNHTEVPACTEVDAGRSDDLEDRLRRTKENWEAADARAAESLQLAENIKLDLRYCNTQLNKSYWKTRWMKENGAFNYKEE